MRSRPVSGLTRLDVPPSHEGDSQWPVDTPTLAYRCGGSPGIQEMLNKFCGRENARRINGSEITLNLVPV